jgi:hypothetical protein
MKYEYERLSSGVHVLSHDEMDDQPVFQVNVEHDHDMHLAVRILEDIQSDMEQLTNISCDLIDVVQDMVNRLT